MTMESTEAFFDDLTAQIYSIVCSFVSRAEVDQAFHLWSTLLKKSHGSLSATNCFLDCWRLVYNYYSHWVSKKSHRLCCCYHDWLRNPSPIHWLAMRGAWGFETQSTVSLKVDFSIFVPFLRAKPTLFLFRSTHSLFCAISYTWCRLLLRGVLAPHNLLSFYARSCGAISLEGRGDHQLRDARLALCWASRLPHFASLQSTAWGSDRCYYLWFCQRGPGDLLLEKAVSNWQFHKAHILGTKYPFLRRNSTPWSARETYSRACLHSYAHTETQQTGFYKDRNLLT